ncbi:hypothetical protein Goarm_010029 [Gossypium armourianum]|uniref:AMP-dependent synthetase/ligase domain-containing protein n=1 Tax=Gossypium armourianum TaxID=34283 RepID=A0A7J9JUU2_9ROSI|nr:hypothetical protein [Gossypium armourianum]
MKILCYSDLGVSVGHRHLTWVFSVFSRIACIWRTLGGPYLDAHVRACVGDEFKHSSYLGKMKSWVNMGLCLTRNPEEPSHIVSMFDYLWSKTIATILWPLHVLATKFVYKKIRSAIGIQKTAKSGGGSLPTHIEKFYEAIGLEVQNGYGLTETSPCIAGRRPYYNVRQL